MAWLVTQAQVLASAEVAPGRGGRVRGLLGRDSLDGAFVLKPCRWVHTFGMRFDLDVAYLATDGSVIRTVRMHRNRLGMPTLRARAVIEAEAGAFGRWGLHVGHVIEIRE
jgi:uncharacterized membrane protein (UPF0127 family)